MASCLVLIIIDTVIYRKTLFKCVLKSTSRNQNILNIECKVPQNGVTALFNSDSDLSGILKYPEAIYVSSAIQKAKIIVNEAGSESAAANGN